MDSGMYPVLLTEKSYELKRKKKRKEGPLLEAICKTDSRIRVK